MRLLRVQLQRLFFLWKQKKFQAAKVKFAMVEGLVPGDRMARSHIKTLDEQMRRDDVRLRKEFQERAAW